MVAFAGAANRHVAQVLVDRVDAEYFEPVADAFHVLEAQVPAAGAVSLAERAFHAELVGDAREFPDHPRVAELRVGVLGVLVHEAIDRRSLVPRIHCHIVRHADAVGPFVVPVMAGPFQMVRLAEIVIRPGPVFNELLVENLKIIVADFAPIAYRA